MANGDLWKGKPIVGTVKTEADGAFQERSGRERNFSYAICPNCKGTLNIGEYPGTEVRILTCELLDLEGFAAAGQYFKHEYLVIREKKQ